MKGFIENRNVIFDTVTNQTILVDKDKAVLENPKKYYEDRKTSLQKSGIKRTDNEKNSEKRKRIFIRF